MLTREPTLVPVEDKATQENLQRLSDYLRGDVLAAFHGRFFEITFTTAVTARRYAHKLGFTPKDVLQTYVTEGVTVTWLPDQFDGTDVLLTTTGACTVRAFIGKYRS